ncbi:HDOD domain-containing protein [Paludibacterium paludis]|uniref:HDOD domain-containing protein n=1 Tax=Paludibacterium paludis TaxID=1225769 RepID=A0A918U8I4_9NEIS|nr:HDOD domain-containing protein [Paludibacterium paludis]GGY09054.1 hypothetical protein GCM10011289_09680 [Paludibacterium paludis]
MQVAEIFEKATGRLPMVPKVVQELVASFHRPGVNIDEVADMVGHDQVLTARVLRLANTARFGGNRTVGSLDDAVLLLGFDNLRVLVIASGVTGASASIPGFDMKGFWQRSFEMANTAKCLAKLAKMDSQLGYTCGLLAGIGELVLHVALPEEALKIDKVVAGGADRTATERMVLGVDLTQVGAELARRWNFPDAIQQAILHQHDLLKTAHNSPYAVLTGLSSFLVSGFNRGMSEDEMLAILPQSVIDALGIPGEALGAALPELKLASTTLDELL